MQRSRAVGTARTSPTRTPPTRTPPPGPDLVERLGWAAVAVLALVAVRSVVGRRAARPAPAVPARPDEHASPAVQVAPRLRPGVQRLSEGLAAEQPPTQSGRRSQHPATAPEVHAAGVRVPGRPRLSPVHGGSSRHSDLGQLLTEVALPAGRVVVGRAEEADVRLDHPTVSPRHVALDTTSDGRVRAHDLGTVNGLLVDGVPVVDAELHDGNRLDLGEVQLVFHCDPPADDGGRQGGELGEQPHHREQGRD